MQAKEEEKLEEKNNQNIHPNESKTEQYNGPFLKLEFDDLKENENIERKICTTKIEFDNKKESLTNVDKIKRVRNIPNRYKDSNHRILHKNSKNDKKLQNTQNKNRKVNSHSQVLLDKKNYKNYKIKSMKCSNLLNNKLSIEEKAQKYIKMRFINNEASKKSRLNRIKKINDIELKEKLSLLKRKREIFEKLKNQIIYKK